MYKKKYFRKFDSYIDCRSCLQMLLSDVISKKELEISTAQIIVLQ